MDRNPRVQSCLVAHAEALHSTCSHLRVAFASPVMDVPFSVPPPKAPFRPAHETTLVSTSFGMVDAVSACLRLSFPFNHSLRDDLLSALVSELVSVGPDIVRVRKERRHALAAAKGMIRPLTSDLRALVSDFSRPINGHVDFGLVECLVQVFQWPTYWLVDLLIYGFRPVGPVPRTGCHRPVDEPSTESFSKESNQQCFDDVVRHLTRKAERSAHSRQAEADQIAVWDSTVGECDRGLCVGPLTRRGVCDLFKDSPYGPRPIPAFGIWQKEKLRRIDDALWSLHNALTYMLETIVCIAADFPALVAAEFAKHVPLDALLLRLGTDDIASAYRILVNEWPEFSVAAVWRPAARGGPGVSYFALRGFNFGLKSAPVHLATLMTPLVIFACKGGLVLCNKFYDDVVVVDQACGKSSAQLTLNYFFALLGFPFAPKKHERLRFANPFLGVVTDFSHLVSGYVVMRVKEKRRRRLLKELRDVLGSGELSPAHASRLRGKLYFTTCSGFFGIGRPALQAFTARQYAKRSKTYPLSSSLRSSITFFIHLLSNLPPSRFNVLPDSAKPLYVWSDAMWEPLKHEGGRLVSAVDEETGELFYIAKATIAFVCFDPSDGTWHESSRVIGFDVIRHMVPGKKTYIGQLECLAAEFFLETMPADRLAGRSAIFWIDNLAAKYGLQKAYSKVEDSGRVINAFKVKQAALRLRCWFEYVPSEQNIADLPSRGAYSRMLEVIDAVSSGEWTLFSYAAVLPNFSTWDAPLASLPSRKRSRHGSRGAKRRRGSSSAEAPVGADVSS